MNSVNHGGHEAGNRKKGYKQSGPTGCSRSAATGSRAENSKTTSRARHHPLSENLEVCEYFIQRIFIYFFTRLSIILVLCALSLSLFLVACACSTDNKNVRNAVGDEQLCQRSSSFEGGKW